MSYCPDHGPEMEVVADAPTEVVYLCHEGGEVWIYNGDIPGYQVKDAAVESGDCPNCQRKATPLFDCMGDEPDLCAACWAEHELGARPVSK